ncbi:MAG: hypothetical protein D6722_22840 [Bacteroidetes bacterium]|nr:MAG: hypothetical protein D6722_22840 [Bacteroidota bacterium]
MKKDIPIRKVTELCMAIVPDEDESPEALWRVFIINLKEEPIRNVLISSKGYGVREGETVRTSVLRHFFAEIGPRSYHQVERIQPEVFSLNNEYWVSFSYDDFLFDQKYTFVAGSIHEDFFTLIPLIGSRGVMLGAGEPE